MKAYRRLFITLVFVGVLVAARVYYYVTDDFRLSNITSKDTYEIPFNPDWQTEPLSHTSRADLGALFDQKFNYMGKGAQVYAFGSEDGKYVLKFFKLKHLRPSLFYEWLPPIALFDAVKEAKLESKRQKVFKNFNGYKIASEHDRTLTKLIFVHLNKSDDLGLKATLIDKLGLTHVLNLDDYTFVLQKRGVTFRDHLADLIQKNDFKAVQKSIEAVLDMYMREYKLGIFDHDHGVMHNTGFTEGSPFHLDVGKLLYGEEYKVAQFYENDLTRVAVKINMWLQKNAPTYANELSSSIERFLTEKFGHPVDIKSAQESLLRDFKRL